MFHLSHHLLEKPIVQKPKKTAPSLRRLFLTSRFQTKEPCRTCLVNSWQWASIDVDSKSRKGRSISTISGILQNFFSAPEFPLDIVLERLLSLRHWVLATESEHLAVQKQLRAAYKHVELKQKRSNG